MVLAYSRESDQKWKEEVSAIAGGSSTPIIIPGWVRNLSVVAIPGGGGSAIVQYTLDPEIEIDTTPGGVDWVDWDAGSVTAIAGYTARSAITGVRINALVAAATLKVAANRTQARR